MGVRNRYIEVASRRKKNILYLMKTKVSAYKQINFNKYVFQPESPEIVKDNRLIKGSEPGLEVLLGRVVDKHGEVNVGDNQRLWRWLLLLLVLLKR